jgi:anti-sigma regulatory factor (Ser/Thr protein kinase)
MSANLTPISKAVAMGHGAASLSLRLAAEPQNVARVRDEVVRRAKCLGMPSASVDDLKTIVSEACANVVRHAYPQDAPDRPMEVEMAAEGEELKLLVRDRGTGIRPPTGARPSSLRLGFLLMGSLASCMQLRSEKGLGTELLLTVPLARV